MLRLDALNHVLLLIFSIVISIRTIFMIVSSFFFPRGSINHIPQNQTANLISIIIPIHCSERGIENNIRSILEMGSDLKTEIIIVVDGKSQQIHQQIEILLKKFNNIRVYEVGRSSKANALKKGIQEAHGDVIVLTDVDDKWKSGSLNKLISHFQNPQIDAVAGQVYPFKTNGFLYGCQCFEYIIFYVDRLAASIWHGNTIAGGIGAFKKTIFDDDRFFEPEHLHGEDLDYSLKILEGGHEIICEPESLVYTQGTPGSWGEVIRQRIRWYWGINRVCNHHLGRLFSKNIILRNKLKCAWHLFNLHIYYMGICISLFWFFVSSVLSGSWIILFIYGSVITINLYSHLTFFKIKFRNKITIPHHGYILFFTAIYFYFLLTIRFTSFMLLLLRHVVTGGRYYSLGDAQRQG